MEVYFPGVRLLEDATYMPTRPTYTARVALLEKATKSLCSAAIEAQLGAMFIFRHFSCSACRAARFEPSSGVDLFWFVLSAGVQYKAEQALLRECSLLKGRLLRSKQGSKF
jgi:hypothetical protein